MWLVMTLVQLVNAPPTTIELRPLLARPDCDRDPGDEILVCGRGNNARYRLKPSVDSRFEHERKAETTLFGEVKGAAELESAQLAGGVTSQRIMLRLKLPF